MPSSAVPTWHAASPAKGPGVARISPVDGAVADDNVEPVNSEAPGQERLELARAYLDLGDRDSARQLLDEVVIHGDLAARQQAARMLREFD